MQRKSYREIIKSYIKIVINIKICAISINKYFYICYNNISKTDSSRKAIKLLKADRW